MKVRKSFLCQDLFQVAVQEIAQKIFGLNLRLTDREARGIARKHWTELHSARASFGAEIPPCLILEPPPGLEPGTFALQKRCSTN